MMALILYLTGLLALAALCGAAHTAQLALENWDYQRHVND